MPTTIGIFANDFSRRLAGWMPGGTVSSKCGHEECWCPYGCRARWIAVLGIIIVDGSTSDALVLSPIEVAEISAVASIYEVKNSEELRKCLMSGM